MVKKIGNTVLYLDDCFNLLPKILKASVDLIVTDPPYGIGIDTWDKQIDIQRFLEQVKRILKKTGFFVLFGQMPTVLNWLNVLLEKGFKYKEHIAWIKRVTSPNQSLQKQHESIYIYTLKSQSYYKKTGKYSDVKVPGVVFDTISVEGLQRYFDELHEIIRTGKKERPRSSNRSVKWNQRFNKIENMNKVSETVNFTNVWSFLPENQRNRFKKDKKRIEHPTIKPLLLVSRLLELLSEKDRMVLDPFLGSGTTAVACELLNRRCIGIERDQEFFNICKDRVTKAYEDNVFLRKMG